ncbi:MAG: peptidoglycan editing factor PgeF [Roseitalea sp.]|jgi:YfiH family protein|nr:peptidoglycan editing factor PgeF [Roseitalea sp.]MBO6723127.1 peptidoglycan editing factor PgeF [Roseitalea sp.]MBO6742435.1 peptidoglycan editing factor PgeF [Roseitalea sp.]
MNEHGPPPLQPLISKAFGDGRAVRHGFFTRAGGVSEGLYAGLNVGLGSADDPDRVRENRRRIAGWFGVGETALSGCHQVHSADVITIDAPIPLDSRPRADALVTATSGIPIGVLTADCAPVLFADPVARIIGAAHAGWKGALTSVLDNTIGAMVALGADRANIMAVVGPSISRPNYEVGPEFADRFITAAPGNARWFRPSDRSGHHLFDLTGYCVARLQDAGIIAAMTGECTYADEARFFSYRRTTHRGEPDYGRQMSAIMIV